MAARIKECRICRRDFEAPDSRRTVCDNCRAPEERARDNAQRRQRAALWNRWRPIAPLVEDWHPELAALADELQRGEYISTRSLTAAIRILNRTEGRAGLRSGFVRVAAIALGLARRLR